MKLIPNTTNFGKTAILILKDFMIKFQNMPIDLLTTQVNILEAVKLIRELTLLFMIF